MINVRKLAQSCGLTRTTILYYDRIGLLRPAMRSKAGYRLYDSDSIKQLRQICTYRNAGLSLKKITELLANCDGPNKEILRTRLAELDQQIADLRNQQRVIVSLLKNAGDTDPTNIISPATWVNILRASGMDDRDMLRWHEEFENNAPAAHFSFLRWLGISEKNIQEIRKRSENSETS